MNISIKEINHRTHQKKDIKYNNKYLKREEETRFRGKTDRGCCRGEGAMVAEKSEREEMGKAQRECFPITICLENERG